MRTIILTSFFILLHVTPIGANSRNVHELGVKGYELVWNMQFEQAHKIFDEMIRMEPENALGYFYKSKTYFWIYVFSTDDKEYIDKFIDHSSKMIDIAEKMLDKNEDDIDALFYLGNTYGYLGSWYGETGSWFKAFRYGRKGKKYLKRVIKKDPDYNDAYLGLGMFHYYLDVLPKIIKPLSFLLGLGGDKEKGIDEINRALSKGNHSRDAAKFVLAHVIFFQLEKD